MTKVIAARRCRQWSTAIGFRLEAIDGAMLAVVLPVLVDEGPAYLSTSESRPILHVSNARLYAVESLSPAVLLADYRAA